MESVSSILQIPFYRFQRLGGLGLGLEFMILFLLIVLIMAHLFIPPRITKSRGSKMEHASLLALFWFGLRGILGRPQSSACEFFMKMGSLLYIPFFRTPMIVVSNDYKVIKDMLTSPDEWIDRPACATSAYRANGIQDRGLLGSSGPVWKETRKYAVKTLMELGLGKRSNLVDVTNEELRGLLKDTERIIQKTNNNVPMRGFFSLAAINVVWRVVGGTRFASTDPDFIEIAEATDTITEVSVMQLMMGDTFGSAIFSRVPRLFGLQKALLAQDKIKRHFAKLVQKHQEALRNSNEINEADNFVDHFLRKMNSENKRSINENLDPVFNLENLAVTLYDLFEAGVDTTSLTLECALMFLAMQPEIQRRIRNEIEKVIGDGDRGLSFYTDRMNMPYTIAVISEVHRMASILPVIPRQAARDCYINDHFVKKGTHAAINVHSIRHDASFWGDPYNFRPERFLNGEELDNSKMQRILTFGTGKRVCMGENIANMSTFTFLVGLLRKYELQKANPNEVYGMKINSAFSSRPKPFHLRFMPLNKM